MKIINTFILFIFFGFTHAQLLENNNEITVDYPFSYTLIDGRMWLFFDKSFLNHQKNDSIDITKYTNIKSLREPSKKYTFYYPYTNTIYYKAKIKGENWKITFYDIQGKYKKVELFPFSECMKITRVWFNAPYCPYIQIKFIK